MNIKAKNIYSLFVYALLLITLGCGFHPRGLNKELSQRFEKTYIKFNGDQNSFLYNQITRLIYTNGGNIVDKQAANIMLEITPLPVKSRQVALSGNGLIKEYNYIYPLSISIIDLKTKMTVDSRLLSVNKYIQLDDRKVLASEEQTDITKNSAYRSLSSLVINYLELF